LLSHHLLHSWPGEDKNNEPKYTYEVKMLQSEIESVMNPAPILGSTGDVNLDLYLSSAEGQFKTAQEEVNQRRPVFTNNNGEDVIRECLQICAAAKGRCDSFLGMAQDDIAQKQTRAAQAFSYQTAKLKPSGISDEAVSLRTHGLELLLDSLVVSKILDRLDAEMRSGDALTRYLIRDGATGWIRYYLESRNLNLQEYYALIGRTSGVLETDLQKACDDLQQIPVWEERVASAVVTLKNSWDRLILGILPSRAPLQANSLADAPDSRPLTVGDIRRMYPKMPGFFNQNL
jgi:hypothetical protein